MGRQGVAAVARRLLVVLVSILATGSTDQAAREGPLSTLCALELDDAAFDPSSRRQHLPRPARDPAALEAQLELHRQRAKRTLSHYVMPSFLPTDASSVAARQRRREAWHTIGSRGYGAWANKVVEKVIERRFNPRAQLRFMYDTPWCVLGGVGAQGPLAPTSTSPRLQYAPSLDLDHEARHLPPAPSTSRERWA